MTETWPLSREQLLAALDATEDDARRLSAENAQLREALKSHAESEALQRLGLTHVCPTCHRVWSLERPVYPHGV